MPYPYMGGYYGQGDYYAGDPFIHKTIGGVIKKIGGVLPGPLGTIATTIGGILSPAQRQVPVTPTASVPRSGRPTLPTLVQGQGTPGTPSFTGIQLGGSQGISIGRRGAVPAAQAVQLPTGEVMMVGRKRRGMNPMNAKALRRAARRIDRFTKDVKRVLKHTPYTLARKGARRGGSPGIITKAEASRALRR